MLADGSRPSVCALYNCLSRELENTGYSFEITNEGKVIIYIKSNDIPMVVKAEIRKIMNQKAYENISVDFEN